MRVAVTGVSGFIGSFLVKNLASRGHTVTGLVRPTSRTDHIRPYVERLVTGEQDDDCCWEELLDGAEAVIHNSVDWKCLQSKQFDRHLKTNLMGSIRLLWASAPRQFIFVSTIAVHHDMRPRWHGSIDEDHPLRPNSRYGAMKAAIEAHLWAAHFGDGRSVSMFRPCAVYGIDPELSRSHGFAVIEQLRRQEAFTRTGGGKFVHVDDVASAIGAAVGNPSASGLACNLVDCYARWSDWAVMAAEVMGIPLRELSIDQSSPPTPKNEFTKDSARSIGVEMNRGHDGIRRHLKELVERMS